MSSEVVLGIAALIVPLVGAYLGHLYAVSVKQRDQISDRLPDPEDRKRHLQLQSADA